MLRYPQIVADAAQRRAGLRWANMPATARDTLLSEVHRDFQDLFQVLTDHGQVLVPVQLAADVATEASVSCPVELDNQIMVLDVEVVNRLFAAILGQVAIPKPPAPQPQKAEGEAYAPVRD